MKVLAIVSEMASMTTLSLEASSTEEGGSGDCTAECVTVYTRGCCTCSRTEVKRKAERIVKSDWSETSMLRREASGCMHVIFPTSVHALPTMIHVRGHCSMNTLVDNAVSEVRHCPNV